MGWGTNRYGSLKKKSVTPPNRKTVGFVESFIYRTGFDTLMFAVVFELLQFV